MFECTQCSKTFTRKDSLLRHMETLHRRSDLRKFSLNKDTGLANQFEYTNNHHLFDPLNKQISNDVENEPLSVRDDLLEYKYEDCESDRNDTDENISQALQNTKENNTVKFEKKLCPFEERTEAATQSIKSKFDKLRSLYDIHQAEIETGNESTKKEQKDILMDSNFHGGNISKLIANLQTALDILLVKELQGTGVQGGCDNKNFTRRTTMKRPITLNSTENDENVEFAKHVRYDKSPEFEYNNLNNGQSKDVVIKYRHNAKTLVDELIKLMSTTEIGQQISIIMKSLKEIDDPPYTLYYPAHNNRRKELIGNLNELKETNIGKRIFCIIHELEKADILEHAEYEADKKEYDSDEEDTVDFDEDLAAG